jgi:riboflavin kinase/FMN adenylyltransferase
MDEAGALLGHPYFIDGVVVEGRKRGRQIGFPTANLRTANELIPPHGVYATTLTVDGVVHAAVTNIGINPTFGDLQEAAIETHVLSFRDSGFGVRDSAVSGHDPGSNPGSNPESRVPNPELYGRRVRLGFVQRLRDERHFEDVNALRAQIDADVRRAERLFSRISV